MEKEYRWSILTLWQICDLFMKLQVFTEYHSHHCLTCSNYLAFTWLNLSKGSFIEWVSSENWLRLSSALIASIVTFGCYLPAAKVTCRSGEVFKGALWKSLIRIFLDSHRKLQQIYIQTKALTAKLYCSHVHRIGVVNLYIRLKQKWKQETETKKQKNFENVKIKSNMFWIKRVFNR